MAGRLTHVASRILGGNGVGTRSATAALRQRSGMGTVIVPDKPLHANDELTWDNGTLFPEPCIDRIAVTVGKANPRSDAELVPSFRSYSLRSAALLSFNCYPSLFHKTMALQNIPGRSFSTSSSEDSPAQQASVSIESPRIKFKRPDKTGRHIMQILNKEAVEEVRAQREIPDIQPGHIIQVKVEVPENKRRVSILKDIVIARRNAGINTTFRLRRLVQGVGIESLFLLYSPNIKEIKVLDKKKVRRAKLYYLRERMNPLKK